MYTNKNAPQLSNIWGALSGVLDACLVTRFGNQIVSSNQIDKKVLTLNTSSAHNLKVGQVIAISGAIQAEFNKEYRVTLISNATTIQVDLDLDTALTTLTGTINISLPPLGWIKEFSYGGKRAYRNADIVDQSRPFLRVVDEIDPVWGSSYAKYAKVGIVGQMSDINTMSGAETPYNIADPTRNWIGTGSGSSAYNGWAKWYYSRIRDVHIAGYYDSEGSEGGDKRWLIVGNSDWFYILPSQVNSAYPNIYFFGKLSNSSTSIYGLSSSLQYGTAQNNKNTNIKTALSANASAFLLHGISEAKPALSLFNGEKLAPCGSSVSFPDLDVSLFLADVHIADKTLGSNPILKMPALKWLLNPYKSGYDYITLESDKKFILLKQVCASASNDAAIDGLVAFELN